MVAFADDETFYIGGSETSSSTLSCGFTLPWLTEPLITIYLILLSSHPVSSWTEQGWEDGIQHSKVRSHAF